MNPTLNFHRRHGRDCDGKHAAGTYTSEPEERKKNHKRCQCPIYASGSLSHVAKRFATKRVDWVEAADLMRPHLAANSWDLSSPPLPPTPGGAAPARATVEADGEHVPTAAPGKRETIEAAADAYSAEYNDAAWNTRKLVRYAMTDLLKFAADRGMVYVHEWEPALVRQLRASWGVAASTARKKLGSLKTFFEFCMEEKWITYNPARIKAKRGLRRTAAASVDRQRLPFTDQELQWMYDGCRRYGISALPRQGRYSGLIVPAFKWTGVDLADFISISVYTGLRISDVATFHIDRLLDSGEVHIRTIKGQDNTKVYTWVPEWLAQTIRDGARHVGPYIFGAHNTDKIDSITDPWRERLAGLWRLVGADHGWKVKPEHHRFRHTFARVLLQSGTPVPKVAGLMGNTEEIVRKYYHAWVPELQAETTAILRRAFANTPRPDQLRREKVQAISG